jgi:uncharacterized protein (DUF849 family)
VAAIRKAVPALRVGLSTAEAIDPDPFARAAAVGAWRERPDFVSVNLSELGWMGIVRAALRAGIAVVGLEDVLTLPDGRLAADNAELVAAAVELIGRPA